MINRKKLARWSRLPRMLGIAAMAAAIGAMFFGAVQASGTRGAFTQGGPLIGIQSGYSGATGAVTAVQVLTKFKMGCKGRIAFVAAHAGTAGTGGGNTVLDILVNGTSIYTTTANRPTLLATDTGEFINRLPDTRSLRVGDIVTLEVLSVSTTGHADVTLTVGIAPN